MKKIFLILISIFLCLAVSDVGSVYAKGRSAGPRPKGKQGKTVKNKKGNPPGPKGGPGRGQQNKAAVNTKWKKRADANQDGIVDKTEKNQWNNSKQDRANVDSKWEKRADRNNDGTVDQTEIEQWNANKQNRSDVNTKWEEKADFNQDGTVNQEEMNKWKNRPGKGNPPGPKGGKGAGPRGKKVS